MDRPQPAKQAKLFFLVLNATGQEVHLFGRETRFLTENGFLASIEMYQRIRHRPVSRLGRWLTGAFLFLQAAQKLLFLLCGSLFALLNRLLQTHFLLLKGDAPLLLQFSHPP